MPMSGKRSTVLADEQFWLPVLTHYAMTLSVSNQYTMYTRPMIPQRPFWCQAEKGVKSGLCVNIEWCLSKQITIDWGRATTCVTCWKMIWGSQEPTLATSVLPINYAHSIQSNSNLGQSKNMNIVELVSVCKYDSPPVPVLTAFPHTTASILRYSLSKSLLPDVVLILYGCLKISRKFVFPTILNREKERR